MRSGRHSLVLEVALAATILAVAAGSAGAAQQTISYSIANRGAPGVGMKTFARIVDATLNDPRGWSLGGKVRFKRTMHGSFQITIAAPGVVGAFGGCSAFYSCRSGHFVLFNADRWRHGTPSFPSTSLRHIYRQMVINHEVGHALGFGHSNCSGASRPAPVMQQQSKGLQGCTRNPWPLPSERAALAARLGVSLTAGRANLAIGRRASQIELGTDRRAVLARLGNPAREFRGAGADRDEYVHPALSVSYSSGRVQAISSRARDDRTFGGVGVGVKVNRLRARLRRERCILEGAAVRTCVIGPIGDRLTTFYVSKGRVTSVRIERLLPP